MIFCHNSDTQKSPSVMFSSQWRVTKVQTLAKSTHHAAGIVLKMFVCSTYYVDVDLCDPSPPMYTSILQLQLSHISPVAVQASSAQSLRLSLSEEFHPWKSKAAMPSCTASTTFLQEMFVNCNALRSQLLATSNYKFCSQMYQNHDWFCNSFFRDFPRGSFLLYRRLGGL